MVALVSVETVLLVLLVVLVAGLLRSHAEILRRLGPSADGAAADGAPGGETARAGGAPGPANDLVSAPARLTAPVRPAADATAPAPGLAGTTPAGDALTLEFAGGGAPTLLAFLSTGCGTCAGFWASLADHPLPEGVQTVIVTHGSERERPARVRELAPRRVPVVMSSAAWKDYRVPGAPYFVLVDRSIRGEGVATTWRALSSLVADAIADERIPAPAGASGAPQPGPAGARRARDVDATLAAAGIGPGHPSLYPAGRPPAAGA